MCDPRELRSRAVGAKGRRRQRPKPNFSSLAGDFVADSFSPRSGVNKRHQTMSSSDTSPDSKCPICLDRFENTAYLDHCWHRFCFRCVQEWSKNKAECPLCKQPFHSIVHSMRSEDDFKVYRVRPSEIDSFANPDGRRFRYRTTLTRERRASGYPRRSSSSRRTAPPPDNGILFEGLSGQTTRQRDEEISQMIRRLQSRRQASLEGRSMRQIQEQEIISFRGALYRSGTRVRSIEDGGRYRDISAEFFRRNPACLHRLVPWLKRELTVLFGAHGSLVNIVQHIIMSNMTRYDLESPAFADDLKPFLLHYTEHFLHEFISYVRSPFNIEAYDQHANYDCPAPSREEGSHSESSIITISPDDVGTQQAEHNAFTTDIGQAPWDDETPGPSYLSSDQVRAALSTSLDTSESSDEEPSTNTIDLQAQLPAPVEMNGDSCDSSDNCVIVGYVKPLAERTPEVVELSSDSEESIDDGKSEGVKKTKPIQYLSFNDTDASGHGSPFSLGSRDGSPSYTSNMAASNEKKSRRTDKDTTKMREPSSVQSSPTEREGYDLSKTRKSESHAQHSHRERHALKSKRKRHSTEKRKKKKDGSKHKHKKGKKRSRTHDKGLSGKSQTLSLSSESIESREQSRSRSQSKDYRSPKSKESDIYFGEGDVQSKYTWESTLYSRYRLQDDYESSYRRRAQDSRQSPNPDYALDSFSERRKIRSPRGRSRSRYYYYERSRSRSRSHSPRGCDRTRSEKPSGKRKYKTRHLERFDRGNKEASSPKEGSTFGKPLPKCPDSYKRASSFLDSPFEADTLEGKKKRVSRSPSVEIIYETKPKRKRREKKPHKSHLGSSPMASPVVITIDSDSDKTAEIQDCLGWDNVVSWSFEVPQDEREGDSPSPYLEARDSSYDRIGETENGDKDSIGEETPKRVGQIEGWENGRTPVVESGASVCAGHELSNREMESLGQLPTDKTSLLLNLREKLTEHSHPLDSSEQNV